MLAAALLRIGVASRLRGILLAERSFVADQSGHAPGVSTLDVLRFAGAVEAPLRIARFINPRNRTYLIDVGANNGEWASRFTQLFCECELELWEPNSALAEIARDRFSSKNGVRVIEAAASRAAGLAEFAVPQAAAMGTLHAYSAVVSDTSAHGVPQKVSVALERLDAIARDITNRQVVLKIDVQGHESEVLEGAIATLECVDVAVVETTLAPLYEGRKPTFSTVVRKMELAGLYPAMFPSAGVIFGSHPCEQDVIFIREALLSKLLL